jgi:serine/threonine protein kinase
LSLFIYLFAIAGVSLCVASLLKDGTHAAVRHRNLRSYLRHSTLDVYNSLAGFEETQKERNSSIEHVISELDATLKNYSKFRALSTLNGRLVLEANDDKHRRVIIKTVFDEARRRGRATHALFNEAFILTHLAGNCAPALYQAASTPANRPFIVREHLQGVSLDRVLIQLAVESRPPLYSEVRECLSVTADSVACIHNLGVVHGDLKPANILAEWDLIDDRSLTLRPRTGTTQLLDFESATVIEEYSTLGSISRGTPFFMAPERYAHMQVNETADVYSINALAALLLTGRPQRPGSTAKDRIRNPQLREVIRRGMSVDVRLRPRSISEWKREMQNGFDLLIKSEGDLRVKWPQDSHTLRQEIAHQAVTIGIDPRVEGSFRGVAVQVDMPTMDRALQGAIREADPTTKRLIDLVSGESRNQQREG